jgi:hypothetical protein
MPGHKIAVRRTETGAVNTALGRDPADVAYRRAWLSLLLYPFTFAAAFAIGEGLVTLLTNEDPPPDPEVWQILVSVTPALLVFVIPGILAVTFGRKAMRLGRQAGRVPAVIGTVIGVGFVATNVLAYFLGG